MNSDFYLFIPERSNGSTKPSLGTVSWVCKDVDNEIKQYHGSLKDAIAAAVNVYITVVLPGEDVLSLQAEVPGKNIQRVQQAIPYVLEDSVIDDVELLYFAINKIKDKPDSNQYEVAVINKAYFESIINQLEDAGIYADAMIADYMLLNRENHMFFDGCRVLFNSDTTKCASQLTMAKNILDAKTLNVVSCASSEQNNKLKDELESIDIKIEQCDSVMPLCLVKKAVKDNVLNLLQGPYKKKKDWSQTGKTWFPVAALFLVWLVFQGGLFIYDYFNLSKQNKSINAEINRIYKQTFPDARRIVDAKAQMQQKLSSLRRRKGQSGRSFSEMLSASAAVFAKTKGLVIKSLRYYDGRINIEMQLASLQALDKLKEQLHKEKGYQVDVQNVSSGKDTVTARLQIVGEGQ